MNILNGNLKQCPGWAFRNFRRWTRIELARGTKLFKFTGHTLFDRGLTTPWWALVDPRPDLGDGGLDATLAAARKSGRPTRDYMRDAYAVMYEWNSLAAPELGMLRIQYALLRVPAVAFHGPTSPVPGKRPPLAYPPHDQQRFPGGANQVLIPNLSGTELQGAGISLID
jgi:hypothetical protein